MGLFAQKAWTGNWRKLKKISAPYAKMLNRNKKESKSTERTNFGTFDYIHIRLIVITTEFVKN